jgi:hypothetical protein
MRRVAQIRKQIGKPIIVSALLLAVMLTAQTGFTASERKGSTSSNRGWDTVWTPMALL